MNSTTRQLQYNGKCAFAVSTGKLDVKAGNHSLIINNKEYHFSNVVAKFLFRILPNTIRKADQNWINQ